MGTVPHVVPGTKVSTVQVPHVVHGTEVDTLTGAPCGTWYRGGYCDATVWVPHKLPGTEVGTVMLLCGCPISYLVLRWVIRRVQ